MKEKRKSFAGRIARRMLVWVFFIMVGLSYLIVKLEGNATRAFYSEIYHNKMLIVNEYTRRVISDVYVAVTNNIYYLEHSLDKPDGHKETMERIVESGTRVRSCGISFIADYYPEKGHHFCPYAWRNVANPDVIWKENMGDADLDYLNADWFKNIIETDSAQWSDPFYDGYDNKTTLSAYMAPIHDQDGRTVAVVSAEISLDWLTKKLAETDSTINKNATLVANKFKLKSSSCLINYDGTFITNPDESRIMKDNFFSQIESCDGSDVEGLIDNMKKGLASEEKSLDKFIVDGEECFVFYMPVKYTNWLMVTVVPSSAIDILSILNGISVLVIILLALLAIVIVGYYYVRNGMTPLKQMTKVANSMAKGELGSSMPEMKHNDEICELRDAMRNVESALATYVDEAKQKEATDAEQK